MTQITMCPTKAGKGFKVVHEGTWYYTSISELFKMLNGKTSACKFRTIDEINNILADDQTQQVEV